jgi:hypothetical protein
MYHDHGNRYHASIAHGVVFLINAFEAESEGAGELVYNI